MTERTPAASPEAQPSMSGKETYNAVSDTVTGVNVRREDNLYQGIAILVFALVGALIGYMMGRSDPNIPWYITGGLGFVCGMFVGLMVSGLALGVYRGIRHMQGKHN